MKKFLLLLFAFQSLLSYSQFYEGFENTTGPDALPSTNWTLDSGNWAVFDNGIGTAVRWTTNNTSYSGTNCAYANREQNGTAGATSEDYLATPLINIPINCVLKFQSRTFTAGDQGTIYQVRIAPGSSNQNSPSSYSTVIGQFSENELTFDNSTGIQNAFNIYTEKSIIIPATYYGQAVFIAFVKIYTQPTTAISGDRWLLDNVNLISECGSPSNLSAIPNTTSATLNWSGSGSNYEVENIIQGQSSTGVANATSTTNSLTINGLNPNTTYCYYIRSVCSSGNLSLWNGPFCYTTTTMPTGCGGIFTDSGGANGNYQNNENITTTICPDNPTDIVSVTFTSFSTENCCDHLSIYDGNSSSSPLIGIYQGTVSPGTILSSSPDGCLTFVWNSDFSTPGNGWVANVNCLPSPMCSKPVNVTVAALATSATLSWTQPLNPDTSIATDWQVLALSCGSPIPTETTSGWIESANNNFTYTNLNPDTCYCFYVRAVCSTTENSLWSSQVCATTQLLPPFCGGIFTDSGGVNGSYQNNENITTIICPDNLTDFVSVTFTSFSTENCCDHLSIYDGTSSAAPLIGTYQGSTSPGTITSSTPGGCLTFVWTSDNSVLGSGWIANINCPNTDRIILKAFIDANNNGVKDDGELSFNHGDFLYDINNSGNLTNAYSPIGIYTITDTNPTNLYDFSYQIEPEYQAFYSSGTTFFNDINIETGSGTQFLYFPITLTQTYNDVSIAIVPINAPSPGFYYQNLIVFKNDGIAPASGTIIFVKPTPVTTVTTTQTGTIANATGFTYNYTNLLPNELRSIPVFMLLPTIPTVNLNDLLTSSASISTSGDINLTNNYASNTQIVVGSYDPNDKMESHGGKIVYNEFTSNDYLYYTIRFENTGTAAAENIRIEDVLDNKLDETSIRILSASHDYLLDRIGSNLSWKFNNIQLPVSVPDTQIGKGYVTFKIKPKPGYAIGDIIPNTANIYFDFNPAIVTNTFNTEFVATLANTTFEETDFVMYPNPATNLVTINLKNNAETINSIAIYDVLGKKVKSINSISSSNLNIDVSDLSKGIYIVKLKTDSNLELIKKLVIK